jgi:cytochrome c oxidase assembly protein subunit 15
MACLIFAACMWIMRGLSPHSDDPAPTRTSHRWAAAIAAFSLFQIYLGALVAGLDAGFTYNTWPLMDGAVVPGDLFIQQPFWINLFENPKTVQFVHRLGAYTLFAIALVNMVIALRAASWTTHARRAVVLFALVTIQAAIGITTLLLEVPLHWGLLHQAGALVVFGFAVANWRGYYGEYPRATAIAERD